MKLSKQLMILGLLCFTGIGWCKDLISIDGSSTVFPITSLVAQEFEKEENGKTTVLVGVSGTGGGFKKFCRGEMDISNASRPIKDKEKRLCAANGIEFIELPVALDAVTVVINKENNWVKSLTVDELKRAWASDSEHKVVSWKQINSNFPDSLMTLYGPGEDSGTYDYFTEAILSGDPSRKDYHANEDDTVIVEGVSKDINSMAFFGLAYYEENKDKLNAVPISWNGSVAVAPSLESLKEGSYQPLSRPIFIYVNKKSANRFPFVERFVLLYFNKYRAPDMVKQAGYVPLPDEYYDLLLAQFDSRITGSRFNGPEVGIGIEQLLKRQPK